MTVTVEVKNQRTFDLLKVIEDLGLIHVNTPVPPQTAEKTAQEETPPNPWMRGCSKNIPGGSVEDFLADCHADKERELEIERREEIEAYKSMAADTEREQEAVEWCNAYFGLVDSRQIHTA